MSVASGAGPTPGTFPGSTGVNIGIGGGGGTNQTARPSNNTFSDILSLIGTGAGIAGSALSTSAANAGARPVFPQATGQYLQMLSPLASSGAGTLSSMISTGNPTDVGPAWDAMVSANQRQTKQGYDQLLGSFGASGLRYSSPALNSASDYLSQSNKNFLQILSQYTMQAQEAAQARRLQASQFATQSFGAPALALQGPQGSVLGSALSTGSSDLQTLALLQSLQAFRG